MKRLLFITTVFIIVVSIFLILMQKDQINPSAADMIQEAFSTTGAKAVASEVYIRGKLAAEGYDSLKERHDLLTGIIRNTAGNAIVGNPVFSEINTDNSSGTQADYIVNEYVSIHASALNEKQGSSSERSFTEGSSTEGNSAKESWLTVSLVNTSQKQRLTQAAANLEELMKKYCRNTTVNISITGNIDGTLEDKKIDAICDKILESTGASKVEGLQEEELVSISAFSPSIGNFVRVNGKRINLNVAVRYNSFEGKTYIWLASPVITTEY